MQESMESSPRSVRIQISDQQEEALKQIALEKNCLYAGKGSLSKLLQAIAKGDLRVIEKDIADSKLEQLRYSSDEDSLNQEDVFLIISFKTFLNLKGIVAVVSSEISQAQGIVEYFESEFRGNDAFISMIIEINKASIPIMLQRLLTLKLESLETTSFTSLLDKCCNTCLRMAQSADGK